MKIRFKPKSKLGWMSIGLAVAMPILFFVGMNFVSFYEGVPAGRTIPHDIIARPGVALSMLAGFAAGVAAFICGLVGIVKKKDYVIPVFISTFIGFLDIVWIFLEIIFPH